MLRSSLLDLWSRIASADPGLTRLLRASRICLSLAILGAIAAWLAGLLSIPILSLIFAVVVNGMAPMAISDALPRDRLISTLLYTLVAAITYVVAALLQPIPLAEPAVFVVVVFATMLVQTRSPRAKAQGMGAFMGAFMGGFLAPATASLPVQLAAVLAGSLVYIAVAFVFLPDSPRATQRRMVRAVLGRCASVLEALRRSAAEASDAAARDLYRKTIRLNEAALMAEDQLAAIGGRDRVGLRLRLVNLELALYELIDRVINDAPLARRDRARIRLLEIRLRSAEVRENAGREQRVEVLTPIGKATVELDRIAGALATAARKDPVAESTAAVAARARAAPLQAAPLPLAWSLALRTGLATFIGVSGGMMLSQNRWFWAGLTTFAVFAGTRSSGDTIQKIFRRVGATLAGAIVGVVIATLASGHLALEAITVFACLFIGYFAMGVSDAVFVGCITVMLGLLYSLLGVNADQLLLLRIEETLVGGVAAFVVAVAIVPLKTTDHVRNSTIDVLRTLAEIVHLSAVRLNGNLDASPVQQTRQLDQRLKDLRSALLPSSGRTAILGRPPEARAFPSLFAAVRWAKALATAAESAIDSDQPERDVGGKEVSAVPRSELAPAKRSDLKLSLDQLETRINELARLEAGGKTIASTAPLLAESPTLSSVDTDGDLAHAVVNLRRAVTLAGARLARESTGAVDRLTSERKPDI